MAFISLPNVILYQILKTLTKYDIDQLSAVNKLVHRKLQTHNYWNSLVREKFLQDVPENWLSRKYYDEINRSLYFSNANDVGKIQLFLSSIRQFSTNGRLTVMLTSASELLIQENNYLFEDFYFPYPIRKIKTFSRYSESSVFVLDEENNLYIRGLLDCISYENFTHILSNIKDINIDFDKFNLITIDGSFLRYNIESFLKVKRKFVKFIKLRNRKDCTKYLGDSQHQDYWKNNLYIIYLFYNGHNYSTYLKYCYLSTVESSIYFITVDHKLFQIDLDYDKLELIADNVNYLYVKKQMVIWNEGSKLIINRKNKSTIYFKSPILKISSDKDKIIYVLTQTGHLYIYGNITPKILKKHHITKTLISKERKKPILILSDVIDFDIKFQQKYFLKSGS